MVQRADAAVRASSSALPSVRREVVIIGAGWYGIAAAKTYLEVNSNVSLTIIDPDSSIGGTWSASRIYTSLCADTPSGRIRVRGS